MFIVVTIPVTPGEVQLVVMTHLGAVADVWLQGNRLGRGGSKETGVPLISMAVVTGTTIVDRSW
jgi:hypothetical protein